MKYLVVLCLFAVVLIQQCMSAHIHHEGEKNDEDRKTHMSHEGGDHKGHIRGICDHPAFKKEDHAGHKQEDHTGHKEEDHTGQNHGPVYDSPKYVNPTYDNGYGGVYGVHDHKDLVLQKFRRGPSLHYQ